MMNVVRALAVLMVAGFVGLSVSPDKAAAQGFGVRAEVGGFRIGVAGGDFRLKPRHHRAKPGFRHRGGFARRGKLSHKRALSPRSALTHRSPLRDRPKLSRRPDPLLFGSGPVNDFARDAKRAGRKKVHHPHRRKFRRRFGHGFKVIVPYGYYTYGYDDDYVEEGRDYIRRGRGGTVPPVEHVPRPDVFAGAPPDIRGPRFETARGRGRRPATDYALGKPLPRTLPYVALDWQDYDLPAPPRGEIYVRYAGAVLRIDSTSRVVTDILWPAGG